MPPVMAVPAAALRKQNPMFTSRLIHAALLAAALLLVHPSPATALNTAAKTAAAVPEDEPLKIDLRHNYFSRRGSWITLFPTATQGTLRYYFARMYNLRGDWLDLGFLPAGLARPVAFTAQPSHLSVQAGAGGDASAQIYLLGPLDSVIDGRGFELQLAPARTDLALHTVHGDHGDELVVDSEGWACRVQVLSGTLVQVDGHWRVRPVQGRLRVAIRMARGVVPAPLDVRPAADMAAVASDWADWRARMPAVSPANQRTAEAAWWTLWNLHAPQDDVFVTQAVLESKAYMNSEWPWDHAFVALALGLTQLDAALDEFMIPFANMDARGQLPDRMLPDEIYRGATKPPIHGWALLKLMERHRFSRPQLERVYAPLVRWTEFWFAQRDANRNGLPAYGGENSGWESGWDNATALGDPKLRYESPDLQAYLVLQMRALARIAEQLGRADEAQGWIRRADEQQARLMRQLWHGDRFVLRVEDTQATTTSDSLLPFMPLVLGERLDKPVFEQLADELARRFLTPYGLATEAPASPRYASDGYWRGPIWAPTTYLLIDGLRRGGRPELARDIARRFIGMIERAGGFYENYDALSGAPLCNKAFAWTAAVDLLLMHETFAGFGR